MQDVTVSPIASTDPMNRKCYARTCIARAPLVANVIYYLNVYKHMLIRFVTVRNKVHCPAIDISRIDAMCQSNAGVVPCDNPVPAGTTVQYECKPHFVAVDDKHRHNRHAICQLDGTWNRKLLQCEPSLLIYIIFRYSLFNS